VRRTFEGEAEEEEDETGQPFVHVPGEIPVRDKGGEVIGYELPPMMDDSFEDFDFGSLDWDDMIEEIGDEDDDSYGEGESQ